VAVRAADILGQARLLAVLDVLASLAEAALAGNYVRPRLNEEGLLSIRDGRHPVLESVQVDFPFVPNDTLLDREERQIALITGPNMAGKSTYIRQVALIALLAHMGSFVPAREADICLLDRIFTRVGAMDHLARGQSTFLVEMVETANILNNATDDSLVILDEIGRGTSTYDGMSIAWAVLEYLHNTAGRRPKTLFATHYHELSDLEGRLPRLKNYNVAVLEEEEKIVFLYKIVSGPADRSYGIYAAKLAGVPVRALRRARQILRSLENGQALAVDAGDLEKAADSKATTRMTGRKKGRLSFLSDFEASRVPTSQLSLFDDKPHPVVEKLKSLPVETLTPIEALNLLNELKRQAGEK
jgi:DNA mismatch repair protein MutS